MSVSDAKIKDKYDFQQYVQPENEVEISDSDTEKNKEISNPSLVILNSKESEK